MKVDTVVESIFSERHRDPREHLERAIPNVLDQLTYLYREDMGVYNIDGTTVGFDDLVANLRSRTVVGIDIDPA